MLRELTLLKKQTTEMEAKYNNVLQENRLLWQTFMKSKQQQDAMKQQMERIAGSSTRCIRTVSGIRTTTATSCHLLSFTVDADGQDASDGHGDGHDGLPELPAGGGSDDSRPVQRDARVVILSVSHVVSCR